MKKEGFGIVNPEGVNDEKDPEGRTTRKSDGLRDCR